MAGFFGHFLAVSLASNGQPGLRPVSRTSIEHTQPTHRVAEDICMWVPR